uniref:hypothetical protein n=1 Tax=Streptomyces phytophilus TaxID=722715 RepID=UPI001C6898BE
QQRQQPVRHELDDHVDAADTQLQKGTRGGGSGASGMAGFSVRGGSPVRLTRIVDNLGDARQGSGSFSAPR